MGQNAGKYEEPGTCPAYFPLMFGRTCRPFMTSSRRSVCESGRGLGS
jgi:hypothetical protein